MISGPALKKSLIREQDPLKQGLKLNEKEEWENGDTIREQDPLKQGLKLMCLEWSEMVSHSIREQDPLKQGLKPSFVLSKIPTYVSFASKIH